MKRSKFSEEQVAYATAKRKPAPPSATSPAGSAVVNRAFMSPAVFGRSIAYRARPRTTQGVQ